MVDLEECQKKIDNYLQEFGFYSVESKPHGTLTEIFCKWDNHPYFCEKDIYD